MKSTDLSISNGEVKTTRDEHELRTELYTTEDTHSKHVLTVTDINTQSSSNITVTGRLRALTCNHATSNSDKP